MLSPAEQAAARIRSAPARDADLQELDRFESIRENDCIAMLEILDHLRLPSQAISIHALRAWIRKHYDFRKLKCSKCAKWLRTSEFHRDASKPTGYRSDCIVCHKMIDRAELSAERKKKINDYQREWKRRKAREMRERTT